VQNLSARYMLMQAATLLTMAHSVGTLAPGLLIASPPLGDPNFDRTVVLLASHGEGGALGFVVNRAAPMTLGELLTFAGYSGAGVKDGSPVYLGGPVQPSSGWILCVDPSLGAEQNGVILVGDRLRIISSRTAFDALAEDAGAGTSGQSDPKRRMVLLGYSGWGPGQLEGEIATGSWLPVPLDEGVLFDVALSQRWERAYAILGLTPAGVISMRSVGEA
jgi:putative transcriptional regulator